MISDNVSIFQCCNLGCTNLKDYGLDPGALAANDQYVSIPDLISHVITEVTADILGFIVPVTPAQFSNPKGRSHRFDSLPVPSISRCAGLWLLNKLLVIAPFRVIQIVCEHGNPATISKQLQDVWLNFFSVQWLRKRHCE